MRDLCFVQQMSAGTKESPQHIPADETSSLHLCLQNDDDHLLLVESQPGAESQQQQPHGFY